MTAENQNSPATPAEALPQAAAAPAAQQAPAAERAPYFPLRPAKRRPACAYQLAARIYDAHP